MFHVKHASLPLLSTQPGPTMFHVKQYRPHQTLDAAATRTVLALSGVAISDHEAELIVRHAYLVLEANSRLNLTRIVESDDVLVLHIADSLAFLPHVEPLQGLVLDLGSGAGYPGIPLAALGHTVTLCESIRKKAGFLSEAVSELGLPCPIEARRAEEIGADRRGEFDVVIARAVTSLPALVELASPLLRLGGRLIALKGQPEAAEQAAALRASALCGMRHTDSASYALPRGEGRMVLTYERAGSQRIKLPRRPGLAQKQPLGEVTP